MEDQTLIIPSARVGQNLQHLKNSIEQPERQMDSLEEMVLQNHWVLDLLSLKGGGLDKQPKETAKASSWCHSLFSWSSWFTTLLTAIAGPPHSIALWCYHRPLYLELVINI